MTILATAVVSAGTSLIGQSDPTTVGFFGSYKVAADKMDPSKLPHIGAWRLNFEQSAPGAAPRFSPTAANIFIAENGGIRQEVYQAFLVTWRPPGVSTSGH